MIIAPKSIIRRIDTRNLKDNKVRQDFRLDIKNRFQVFQHYGDKNGEGLTSNVVISTTCSVQQARRPYVLRQVHKYQITTDAWNIIDKRKDRKAKLYNTHSKRIKERLKEQYSSCNRDLKKATKKDRKLFLEDIAREAEKDAIEQRKGDLYQIAK